MISMIGCILGIACTFPAAQAFGTELSIFFPIFHVSNQTLFMDLASAVIIGIIAGIFPTWRSIQIRIADGLRRIG
jgi:putative ABC transport system permease protein